MSKDKNDNTEKDWRKAVEQETMDNLKKASWSKKQPAPYKGKYGEPKEKK